MPNHLTQTILISELLKTCLEYAGKMNAPAPHLTLFIGTLEEKSDELYRNTRNVLPHVARGCLVATFVEDGLRMLFQCDLQQSYVAKVWDCGFLLSSLFVILAVVGQLGAAGLILARKNVDIGCGLLFGVMILQRIGYKLPIDEILPHDLSRTGGLFLLLAEASTEPGAAPQISKLDHRMDLQNLANWLQLAGRVFMAVSVEFGNTFMQVIKLVIGFVLAVFVMIGYRTKLSAIVLAGWLGIFSLYQVCSGLFFRNDIEVVVYNFFANISIIGGLFIVIANGPGTKSVDAKKKYW